MQEIELRFHVPAADWARLRRQVDPKGKAARTRLAAHYFDDAERRLATAGIGLRLRLEGERWVQTVKGPAEDGMTRLEHNAALPPGAEPTLDLARHAGHPLGARLQALGPLQLVPRFRTDILRHHRHLRVPGATLELCLDDGRLMAGDAAEPPVRDLELELLTGSPMALLRHAHTLVTRWPISLDLRSKAERGEHLARGRTQSPARPAQGQPPPGVDLRGRLLAAFQSVGANASQIGSGDCQPDHVEQLRQGLRALEPELPPALRGLRQQLARWRRALDRLGPDPAAAPRCVRDPAVQQALIEWLGWIEWLRQDPAATRFHTLSR